jgi:small GTP-binding protein
MASTLSHNSSEGVFKYIIVGDTSVGKSCLLHRLIEGEFMPGRQNSLCELRTKKIHDEKIELQIWDTPGDQRFLTLTRSFYRDAAGALMVYDVTRRSTFNYLRSWLTNARNIANPNAVSLCAHDFYLSSVLTPLICRLYF